MKKYFPNEIPAIVVYLAFYFLVVSIQIGLIGTAVYIAMHFIKKYW